MKAIIRHDDGFLCTLTAFGKTAVAAWLIATRSVNALILVHRQQLLDQWRERLAMFLDLPIDEIGQVAAGKTKRTGKIDVAVIQSLYRDQEMKDFVAEYGHVIVDECHHLSAFTVEKVMRRGAGEVRDRSYGNTYSEGRPSSDHVHAVRAGALQNERTRNDRHVTI